MRTNSPSGVYRVMPLEPTPIPIKPKWKKVRDLPRGETEQAATRKVGAKTEHRRQVVKAGKPLATIRSIDPIDDGWLEALRKRGE